MKIIYKSCYKARFPFYHQITGLILILDGLIELFAGFFGYGSDVYVSYCEWNIKSDIKKRKKERERRAQCS